MPPRCAAGAYVQRLSQATDAATPCNPNVETEPVHANDHDDARDIPARDRGHNRGVLEAT